MSQFRFELTDEEKNYLKDVARESIKAGIEGRNYELPEPVSPKLTEEYGAFVCLKLDGNLRGCIGNVIGEKPLNQTVAAMAQSAAFEDPRFSPLRQAEFERLEIEISILSPFETVKDASTIEPGRHGLMIQKGFHSGLLLPQVATEYGWDRETFLAQTCRKAGLPPHAWQSKKTQVLSFEAEVF